MDTARILGRTNLMGNLIFCAQPSPGLLGPIGPVQA